MARQVHSIPSFLSTNHVKDYPLNVTIICRIVSSKQAYLIFANITQVFARPDVQDPGGMKENILSGVRPNDEPVLQPRVKPLHPAVDVAFNEFPVGPATFG